MQLKLNLLILSNFTVNYDAPLLGMKLFSIIHFLQVFEMVSFDSEQGLNRMQKLDIISALLF